ncbi:MAG: AlwI family type II restriction endonuclease [Armatimonadetes bacterium]|nr:AlwI family type II restriction endonuclease [Armatimonadota bacterium]
MIQWTIGTTTVRNPDRLRDGLLLFAERFAGKPWDEAAQAAFFDGLVERRIYETAPDTYARMRPNRKQEHARKWISVLNQLGFCYAYKGSDGPALLTPAGEALLRSPNGEPEAFLRQIWKYRKPAPLPNQNGPSFEGVRVHPGWLSLRIVHDLHGAGLGGISREEMTLYLTTTLRDEEADAAVERIKGYRAERGRMAGAVAKRNLFGAALRMRVRELIAEEHRGRRRSLETLADECRRSPAYARSLDADAVLDGLVRGGKGARTLKAQETKRALLEGLSSGAPLETLEERLEAYHDRLRMDTLKDYADLTSRYLRKTGLFTIQGDRLAVIEDRLPLIEELLENPPAFHDDEAFLEDLWAADRPRLPTDDVAFLKREIRTLTEQQERVVDAYPELTLRLFSPPRTRSNDVEELRAHANALRQNVALLREMEFFHRQSRPEEIRDILSTFEQIERRELMGGEAYRPAYYEWAAWRLMLAISAPRDGRRHLDALPETTRGFRVDEAMQPLHHAAPGAPDMVFPFRDYVLVVEVTLNTRENQWSAEGEPVPRHVGAVQSGQLTRPVYGLFVAPVIEPNTALTFHRCRHYVNGRITDLAILPFTTDQFKDLARTYLRRPFGPGELRELLERLDAVRREEDDPLRWLAAIPTEIAAWSYRLTAEPSRQKGGENGNGGKDQGEGEPMILPNASSCHRAPVGGGNA